MWTKGTATRSSSCAEIRPRPMRARRPVETAGCAGLARTLSLRRQANRPPRAARLAEQFGARYQQRGHELGGHGHTTVDGIDRLRLDAERATLLLLCMEEAPGDCHRHHAICGPHFPGAVHIFRDDAIHSQNAARCARRRRCRATVRRDGRLVPLMRRGPRRGASAAIALSAA
jgi:hypothetical protein